MSRSKNKKKKFIIVGAIIIAIILLAIFIPMIGKNNLPPLSTTQGYTTLSISNVEIIDSGSRIRIYGVAYGAEEVSINFNPSKLNEFLVDKGYSATKSVTGSIKLVNPTREFYAIKDSTKIFANIGYYELGLLSSCENNKPSGLGADIKVYRIKSTGICAYEMPQGIYAYFSGQMIDNSPVFVNIDGSAGTLNPSSGSNVLILNDGKTKIEWVGNLVNYQGLSVPNNALLFKDSKYEKLINKDSWSSFENLLVDFKSNADIGLFSTQKAKDEINAFNNAFNQIMQDKTSDYINSVNVDGAVFTNNGLKIDLTTPTVFPTFIITLDASSVGIIELKGKPEIISCVSDKTINSGDTYSTNVQVKNVGGSAGSFYAQLSCSGSSGASGVISERLVEKGETTTLPVQVSGTNSVSGTQSNTCTIKIIDRKSQDSDSCSFSLDVKYQQNYACTPNQKTCQDSKHLKICNSDGTKFTLKECEFGCKILESGEAMCSGNETEENPCPPIWGFIPNIICKIKNSTHKFFTVLKFFLILLGFIFSLFASRKLLDNFKDVEDRPWLGWTLSFLIAGGVAYLLYLFIGSFWFWIILLLVLVYNVIFSNLNIFKNVRTISRRRR